MLDLLKAYNAKATFFINANNNGKGQIQENWRPVIEKMMADGHQVASHSYAHMDLSKITQQQRIDQMVFNEMSINDIIGMIPTYSELLGPPCSRVYFTLTMCQPQCVLLFLAVTKHARPTWLT